MDTENIKIQKLLLKYEGNYDFSFLDENKNLHKDDYSFPYVDVYNLAKSCFEPLDLDDDDSILTCSCGYPECAGIHNFNSWITDNEICWKVNDDYLKFEKNQYIEQVKSVIDLLLKVDPQKVPAKDYDYITCNSFDREILTKMKSVLCNYSKVLEEFSRYKIILCPKENKIYINEEGKYIGIKKGYLKFYGKDVFEQDLIFEIWEPEVEKWASDLKNCKEPSDFVKWNYEGIRQAKKIRQELPLRFDVWYRYQGQEKEDLHILKEDEKKINESSKDDIWED